jgi:hypothetical protein
MICAPRGLDVHADEDQEKKRQEWSLHTALVGKPTMLVG